eukprot:GILK01003750.1.p1 GENE.GILK01003750.1~~GILK01003750.1.p1  ORF type:complete len:285 (-),score=54.80 GILK01003750.1:62-916(-)
MSIPTPSEFWKDEECPICRNATYLKPDLKLLISSCGHRFCQDCVNRLFSGGKTVAACPICRNTLRKGNFTDKSSDQVAFDKEVNIRRKVNKIYNKRREDFDSLQDYNNFLEEVEDVVFNLVNDIDVAATNARMEKFRAENQAQIIANEAKKAEDERKLLKRIIEEEGTVKFLPGMDTTMLSTIQIGEIAPMQVDSSSSSADGSTAASSSAAASSATGPYGYQPKPRPLPANAGGFMPTLPQPLKAPARTGEVDKTVLYRAGGFKAEVCRARALHEAMNGLLVFK